MNRRHFLQLSGAAASLTLAPRWLRALPGAETTRRRLVLVLLDGGNDGLNTLAPVGDDLYHRARPALALSPRDVHPIDEYCGLHSALARLAARYADGGLALVNGVGYPNPNLSHFRSMDIWESASTELPIPASGWLGRMVDGRPGGNAPTELMALGQIAAPVSLRAARHTAYAVPGREGFRIRRAPARADAESRWRALSGMQAVGEEAPSAAAARGVHAAGEAIAGLERALEASPRVDYPDGRLARELEIAARVIEADLATTCFHVRQPGYDTHANQAKPHAALLSELDGALDAFLRDLAAVGRLEQTLVLVVSEFGRRVAENGIGETAGTDHGAASLVMLLGGGVRGGLHGPVPRLDDLDAHGNLEHTVDFRRIYADVVESWFGMEPDKILGRPFEPLGLVNP